MYTLHLSFNKPFQCHCKALSFSRLPLLSVVSAILLCIQYFLFPDGEEASIKSAQEIIQPVAEEYFKMEEPPVYFFYTKGDDTSDSLRDFVQLPDDDNLLVILDIPSQKVYISEDEVLTREGVHKFVSDFTENKLDGKNLRGWSAVT